MTEPCEKKDTQNLVDSIVDTYEGDSGINFIDVTNLPVREKIISILDGLMELLFPGYTGKRIVTRDNIRFIVGDILCVVRSDLAEQISLALRHACRMKSCPACDCDEMAEVITDDLLGKIPEIRRMLKMDVQAAFDGDPAAQSLEEIVISYPYINAIASHRVAHELFLREVPLIPRIMSECAHSRTGIDIHPGAKIGERFFIDHATGVVVGETSVIGNKVKFYQGVSLVAISIPKDAQTIKGVKRHPTIEDDVTIYAEATILGDVTIGKGSIVGANAWVRESVGPGMMVAMALPETELRDRKGKSKS